VRRYVTTEEVSQRDWKIDTNIEERVKSAD
jgi:hypothetical protein